MVVSVSEGTLLVYTMPIWAMLFAWPCSARGRTCARSPPWFSASPASPCCLAARFCLRRRQDQRHRAGARGRDPVCARQRPQPGAAADRADGEVAWQVGLGCLRCCVRLAFEQPESARSGRRARVLVYMTLVPMGLCYLTWFERCDGCRPRRRRWHADRADHRRHRRRPDPRRAAGRARNRRRWR